MSSRAMQPSKPRGRAAEQAAIDSGGVFEAGSPAVWVAVPESVGVYARRYTSVLAFVPPAFDRAVELHLVTLPAIIALGI